MDDFAWKMVAARRALLVEKVTRVLHQAAVELIATEDVEKTVSFLCQSDCPFGVGLLKQYRSDLYETLTPLDKFAGFALPLGQVEESSPLIHSVILERMDGLFGYFPIVVAAYEGYTVFPWPFDLRDETGQGIFVRTRIET